MLTSPIPSPLVPVPYTWIGLRTVDPSVTVSPPTAAAEGEAPTTAVPSPVMRKEMPVPESSCDRACCGVSEPRTALAVTPRDVEAASVTCRPDCRPKLFRALASGFAGMLKSRAAPSRDVVSSAIAGRTLASDKAETPASATVASRRVTKNRLVLVFESRPALHPGKVMSP